MTWGSFGIVHIIKLLISAGIVAGLYFLLRRLSAAWQTAVLGILSLSGIAAIIFNLTTWGSPLEYLPFHLCSLNAIVLPIAVFTKNKTLNNMLLLWAFGSLAALVVNTAQADYEIFSLTFLFYYIPHTLEVGIPVLMFLLGHVKKDARCIWSTLLITLAAYTVVHIINVVLNSYFVENALLTPSGAPLRVNYMYSIKPENPLLQLFYDIIPSRYWYMLLAVPIVGGYLCILYADKLFGHAKGKKPAAATKKHPHNRSNGLS